MDNCYNTKSDDDSDNHGEGLPCYWETDSSWDNDDEVEEANRSDDIIKIIEGDW